MDVNALKALWSAARGRRTPPRSAPRRRFLLGFLLVPLAVYLAAAALWAGYRLGGHLPELDAVAVGKPMWRLPLLLAMAGALWDGGCVVAPAPCRPHFIAPRTLLLAEAMLGLTTLPKLVLGGLGLMFSLGMAWGGPWPYAMGLVWTGVAIVWTACLERVIHHLLPAGLLRQRAFLVVFLGLGAGFAGLSALAGRPPSLPFLGFLEHAWSLPGVYLVRFWQTAAPIHLMPLLVATAGLLALTGASVRRELAVDRRPGSALAGGGIWSFQPPWLGVARLQCQQILASRAGQMRLLMLLLSVLIAKEPELITVGSVQIPRAWTAMAAGLSFGAILVAPLSNVLGFDRGGVRTWWAAPLPDRELLLGKVLGCAAYAALGAPILLALLYESRLWRVQNLDPKGGLALHVVRSTTPLGGGEALALVLLLGALFLWWAGSGLRHSLRTPQPLGLGSYAVSLELDENKMARIGLFLAPLGWMVPGYACALLLGWGWVAAVMAVVLGVALERFRRRLGAACGELEENREDITLALAAGR